MFLVHLTRETVYPLVSVVFQDYTHICIRSRLSPRSWRLPHVCLMSCPAHIQYHL